MLSLFLLHKLCIIFSIENLSVEILVAQLLVGIGWQSLGVKINDDGLCIWRGWQAIFKVFSARVLIQKIPPRVHPSKHCDPPPLPPPPYKHEFTLFRVGLRWAPGGKEAREKLGLDRKYCRCVCGGVGGRGGG
jgi:hypothetical protein